MNTILIVVLTCFFLSGFSKSGYAPAASQTVDLQGAWQTNHGENEVSMICSEKYFSVAIYNPKQKTFAGTHGGSYRIEGNEFAVVMEFHSMNPELVGKEIRSRIELKDGLLTFTNEEEKVTWKHVDNGTPGKLAGAWLITGRIRDGQMGKMTPGARRTMKILSGTRFQWIAYNVDTKEFSGTGGGTYTTENGKYTENIGFFSRDNARVGASLTFDFSIEDGKWRHQGKSSKGDPVDEVWTKREKIGL